MTKHKILHSDSDESTTLNSKLSSQVEEFAKDFSPSEGTLLVMEDSRTGAIYCECHVRARKLIDLGTIDVPLDPDDQPEYRANRDIVEDNNAYERMRDDARLGRSFSNLVAEYESSADDTKRLKVIGGQHRFEAIRHALDDSVDEYHGVKVYFDLDTDQRLDVQLISNTNIAVSPDLLDRMYETVSGPELRDWCQEAGLLQENTDFADKRGKGRPITVRAARTFIMNYFAGVGIAPKTFSQTKTTPFLAKTGLNDTEWAALKKEMPALWNDEKLKKAGKEYAKLIEAQRDSFDEGINPDSADKANNYAVLSAWAFTAGLLSKNAARLKRHYGLKNSKNTDPLNAAMLAKGRHRTDADNYRGLGYRTDAKERGRFVELFYAQTEKGDGIRKALIDVAIKRYHAKQAMLEAQQAEEKL